MSSEDLLQAYEAIKSEIKDFCCMFHSDNYERLLFAVSLMEINSSDDIKGNKKCLNLPSLNILQFLLMKL